MRIFKNLSLAAIAAAAFMAFLGAGTASATQLCTDSGSGCTEYSGDITATSTDATFATNIVNVECSHSYMTIHANSSTGAPILGEITALSFTGCRTEVTHVPCMVPTKNLPYSAELEGKTLTITDAVGVGVHITCGTELNCDFLTNKAVLTITNGAPTVARAESVSLSHETGAICPASATWSGTYKVTSPTGLTVL